MDKPEIVPDKLDSSINVKLIILIIGTVISFQIFTSVFLDLETSDVIFSIVSFVNPLSVAIVGFIVAKRYFGTQIFGKAYFSLALGFLMIFLAEVAYLVYDLILGIDPYPSVADVFFFSFYPLAILHLVLNIKFFQPTLGIKKKLMTMGIPILIITSWSIVAFQESNELNFDFYFGLVFVIVTSFTLSLSALGSSIFKEGVLGRAWLILLVGILSITAGDVWYYYLEIFDLFDLTHPVNVFWYAGYWIVVYALIKHKEII